MEDTIADEDSEEATLHCTIGGYRLVIRSTTMGD